MYRDGLEKKKAKGPCAKGPCAKWAWLNADGPVQNIEPTVTIQHIFQVLNDLNVNGCIAGGAAAVWTPASDIDVFVFGTDHQAEDVANQIGQRTWAPTPTTDYSDGNKVIATCYPLWANKPVQVIRSDKTTVQDLLDSFDLSVHMYAIVGWDGAPIEFISEKATTLADPIKVYLYGHNTHDRLNKLCARYHLPFIEELA